MARFFLKDYIIFENSEDVVATSWQVSRNAIFTDIIEHVDLKFNDPLTWECQLFDDIRNEYIDDTDPLYVRCKIFTENGKYPFVKILPYNGRILFESDWFLAKEYDPRHGRFKVTHKGIVVGEIQRTKDNKLVQVW